MLNYEEIKKIKIKKNLKFFKNNYTNKEFQEKIEKHCNKFNIPILDVENRIKEGDLITMSIFSKDPSKQNFYEKTAAQYIKQIDGVYEFKNLPNSGKNVLFILEDNILTKAEKEKIKKESPSKSIDFMWKFRIEEKQFYAYHKYIKENGGAQDNQFNDVIYSIMAARKDSSNNNHIVLFICDGEYFNEKRMEQLKDSIKNKNHHVLTINKLNNFLESFNKNPPKPKAFTDLLDKAINYKQKEKNKK